MDHLPVMLQRELVPEPVRLAPPGFNLIEENINRGLPYTIRLDEALSLVLVLPTGLAATWRDADPMALISRAEAERRPSVPAEAGEAAPLRPPLRLLVRQANRLLASIPLAAGLRRKASEEGVRLELIILDWELRAGNLRGPGNFGSRLSLAWRRAGQGVDQFANPAIHPNLSRRLSSIEEARRIVTV